jgi:hypothetical protein
LGDEFGSVLNPLLRGEGSTPELDDEKLVGTHCTNLLRRFKNLIVIGLEKGSSRSLA